MMARSIPILQLEAATVVIVNLTIILELISHYKPERMSRAAEDINKHFSFLLTESQRYTPMLPMTLNSLSVFNFL